MTTTQPLAPVDRASEKRSFDVERTRKDFPILERTVHDKPLVYFDNAATTQNPRAVLDTVKRVYEETYSNVHRGIHHLSHVSTEAFEEARRTVQSFLNAASDREIVFVRGTTEAINLVANTYGKSNVGEGDEILITEMEHHSNIVPWQMLCEEKGASLRVAPINDKGELILDEFESLLTERTKLVAVAHVSNVLGTVNPIREMVQLAHAKDIPVFVDGAQSAPHMSVDMADLDCDFYAFSGHKVYGPGGIGVLYGKEKLLEAMPPYQGGGSMIDEVTFERTTYGDLPNKFEAGTPNIAGTLGLAAAIDYVTEIGLENIAAYESELVKYAMESLESVPGLRFVGTAQEKASVVSFVMDVAHPSDIGSILDFEGVAIRSGHLCAQPLLARLGLTSTARASLAFYNTEEEIDTLARGLRKVIDLFS